MANYNLLEARANLARTVAEEGIVLLKNEGNKAIKNSCVNLISNEKKYTIYHSDFFDQVYLKKQKCFKVYNTSTIVLIS